MDTSESILAAKSDAVKLEVVRLTSLISLCEGQGISPGISIADVDAYCLPFLTEPTELGYTLLSSRLVAIHKHLHELLYAPPRS